MTSCFLKKSKVNRQTDRLQQGFTITELTIAMAFLTILMFILLISSFYFVGIFNKGITLKRVNQSGRTIGAELQSSLRHTNSLQSDSIKVVQKSLGVKLVDSRACTGSYSYIWSVYGKTSITPITQTYSDGSPIGFVKIFDTDGAYCTDPNKEPDKNKSTELLADGLVIREPVLFKFTTDSKLTTFTYTISTPNDNDELEFDDATGRSVCKGGSARDFCALNTFIVTVYSKGI